MRLLALDTATSRTDVAIVDGEHILAHAHADGATAHGEALGIVVSDVLNAAGSQVDAVAVGTGPGPFTGLRVGLAFARTFAFARSIPVYGICTLDVLAAATSIQGEFLVATDARRKEIYWARYIEGVRVDGPHVEKPAEVAARFGVLPVVGEGAHTYAALFPHASGPLLPDAAALARLAMTWSSEGRDLPIDARYLRQPDVTP
jgi:tRNA threonylcarbamoyl adenosine modification protein YeaZ